VKIVGLVLLGLFGLILFLLLLLLLVPFRFYIGYREKTETLTLRIKFLFIHLTLLPGKKKKQKKKKEKEEKPKEEKKKKEKKPSEEKKPKAKPDIKKLLPLLKKHLPKLFGCFKVSSLNVLWYIHKPDAKDTAVHYGAWSSIIGFFLGLLERYAKHLGKTVVDLFPDYEGTKEGFKGNMTISFTIGSILRCLIGLVIDVIKMKII